MFPKIIRSPLQPALPSSTLGMAQTAAGIPLTPAQVKAEARMERIRIATIIAAKQKEKS